LLNAHGVPVWLCLLGGSAAALLGGVVLAVPALRLSGPYFGLTTLVAVLLLQQAIIILAGATGGEIGLTMNALEQLRSTTPITVLLGEQNVTFALPHADRIYVMEHARVVWEGEPSRFAAEVASTYL
jgi:branched-chain amino acid transport system ATP-binding protein